MRIAACIILYHPDPSDLEKDILAVSDHVDTLILWRNSSEEIVVPNGLSCNVIWMGDGKNQYIAGALNRCLSYCSENGFDYLLTLDQDSEFGDFGSFLARIATLRKDPGYDKTIIFAPNINHRYDTVTPVIPVESTITSGSLCDVPAALAIGGFRESYQIYWVDSEFCHRARLAGYQILTLTEFNLKQQFGRKTKVHGITCYNYAAQTYYFLFRNMLWMHREYRDNPNWKCMFYSTGLYLKSILVGETGKWKKIKAVARGLRHGMTRRYE